MTELMSLAIGWTIVGGFVFTMIATLLSLVGWIKFADPSQQKKLFSTLIVGVVVTAGAGMVSGAKLDPEPVAEALDTKGRNAALVEVADEMLASPEGAAGVDKETLNKVVRRMRFKQGSQQEQHVRELRAKIDALPGGKVGAAAVKELHTSPVFGISRPKPVPHSK